MSEGDFLSRWSRRKIEARQAEREKAPAPATPAAPPVVQPAPAVADASQETAPAPLPPIESLTPDSDFTPFMQPDVAASVRREALKTLFQDPRFNVMDGLDVYIDDYSKPDPLPEGWLEKLEQMTHLGNYQPPPPEETAVEAAAAGEIAQAPQETQATPEAQEPLPGKDSAPPAHEDSANQ